MWDGVNSDASIVENYRTPHVNCRKRTGRETKEIVCSSLGIKHTKKNKIQQPTREGKM